MNEARDITLENKQTSHIMAGPFSSVCFFERSEVVIRDLLTDFLTTRSWRL